MATYCFGDIHNLCTLAYLDARKNERSSKSQLAWEINLERNIYNLSLKLYKREWKPSPPIVFAVSSPVPREIFAPQFEDRVVSHIAYNLLVPIFERIFIYDTYSCRKGKGTLFGIDRFEHHLRCATNNWKKEVYILNEDISGYFMSINRATLLDMIKNVLNRYGWMLRDCEFLKYIIETSLLADPMEGCKRIGSAKLLESVPKQKRMEYAKDGCGIILGDVKSQMFSNLYLNEFDHTAKRVQKIRYYSRYVDDVRKIHESKDYLEECAERDREYLSKNLGLTLHPNKCVITRSSEANTFLGSVVLPYRRYIGNDAVSRMKDAVRRLESADDDRALSVLNSYAGFAAHFDSWNVVNKVFRRNNILERFGYDGNRFFKLIK